MDLSVYLRFVLALAGVLALIVLAAFVFKRIGFGALTVSKGSQKRLGVVASLVLDGRHRLILVRRDEVEHLLLVGGPTDLVVEGGIGAAAPRPPGATGSGASS